MPSRVVRYTRYSPQQRRRRLLASRTVRFCNDVLFLDHIRQGDLEQVGRFVRARKVALDTIYPSGKAQRLGAGQPCPAALSDPPGSPSL